MSVWKAVIVAHSDLDINGTSEVTFNVFEDASLRFSNQHIRVQAGTEDTVIRQHLQRHQNEANQYVRHTPGDEVFLV